jgi:hypothetical protein
MTLSGEVVTILGPLPAPERAIGAGGDEGRRFMIATPDVPIGVLRTAGRARLLDAHSVFGESVSRADCRVSSRAGASGSTTEALPTTRREARRRMLLPKGVGAEPMTATKDSLSCAVARGRQSSALGEGGGRCR